MLAQLFTRCPLRASPQLPPGSTFSLPPFLILWGGGRQNKLDLWVCPGDGEYSVDRFTRFHSDSPHIAVQQAGFIYAHVWGLDGLPKTRPFSVTVLTIFITKQRKHQKKNCINYRNFREGAGRVRTGKIWCVQQKRLKSRCSCYQRKHGCFLSASQKKPPHFLKTKSTQRVG